MKPKTKVIDKFIIAHFIPVIYDGKRESSRELGPRLSEAEAWSVIEAALAGEPEGSFGEVEPVPSKHIKVVEKDGSGLIVPNKPGKLIQ